VTLALALVVTAGVAVTPWLPGGPDIYVHVVWAHQVMRCVTQGSAPLWLPDLNAGFGSPGIRLYSPLGPTLTGLLAMPLGDAGSGVRIGLLAAAALVLLVAQRRGGMGAGLLVVLSPVVLHSLFGRGAVAEFLAVPLLLLVLDDALSGTVAPVEGGVVLALLWLLHAPSTLMALGLLALATLLRRDGQEARRLAAAGALAAALTAWHWLPLASEMALVANRAALVEGIFEPVRNLLGSPSAHDPTANVWLGWAAVALLAAMLVGRWWRSDWVRAVLIVVCVLLASPLARPLWELPGPARYLQFPWRWLLPAALLAARPLRAGLAGTSGRLAAALVLAPLAFAPLPRLVPDPALNSAMGWREAGAAVHEAMGGNPYLVDAAQNRPRSFDRLAENIGRFGGRLVLVGEPGGRVAVASWRPLRREVTVEVGHDALLSLRLLEYPFWHVSLDGVPVSGRGGSGVLTLALPAGRHAITVWWAGNPRARTGQWAAAGAAVVASMWCALGWWRRRRRNGEAS